MILTLLISIAALLYSSVGHGGASGYLAAMALFGLNQTAMKPSALVLNLFVSGVGSFRYGRAGCFSWPIFWPFAIFSVPCAFVGGAYQLPGGAYRVVLGLVLLFAAWQLAFKVTNKRGEPVGGNDSRTNQSATSATSPTRAHDAGDRRPLEQSRDSSEKSLRPPPMLAALAVGAPIGLLSGLVGVGGGIFLSPLLLLLGWADVRRMAGVSAVFILVNSAAGLLGQILIGTGVQSIPHDILWWTPAALVGGLVGSELGSRRLAPLTMRRLLAAVLVVAAIKLVLPK
ncbi:MAG: hypothetical protein C5B50_25820 [Verrucomicrobia bacterium]|nr:MAG: hypothetical protein C5B50_25820 [Verrucomicrobiota bacterium]